MTGQWIGFAGVVGPTILLAVFFWLRFKGRQDTQETIRAALDKGQELSPELIDRLGHPKPPANKDVRLAVIWLAIAVGFLLMAFGVPEPDAFRPMLMAAAFPFTIGTAYLILHKFAKRD